MTVRIFSPWLVFAAGLALAVHYPDYALSEASGPDFYRVIDVAADDTLHMRVGPSPEFPILAEIPHDADGVANLGCMGGLTLEQWQEATEDERQTSRDDRWCLVGYDRAIGWVSGRFIAEGQPPDRFHAGAPLSEIRGSEWRVVRIGNALAGHDAMIAFRSDLHVSGKAGCNRFGGSYAENQRSLAIGPLATSRKVCPEPIMAFETQLLEALETSTTFVARHLVLALFDDRSAILVQFLRTDWD